MKKMYKITSVLAVLLILPLSLSTHFFTKAATTYDSSEMNGTTLHDVPTRPIENVAQFNATKEVVVNKASVQTKATSPSSTIISAGLLPKAGRTYTYEPSFQGPEKKTYSAERNPYFDQAVNLLEDEYTGFTYIETANSFSLGIANSDVFYFSLDYPMKAKTTIRDTDYGIESDDYTEVTVVSTSQTVQTKAGTFKNVVVLQYPNGSTLFIAKDYGIIKITDYDGSLSTELIAVES